MKYIIKRHIGEWEGTEQSTDYVSGIVPLLTFRKDAKNAEVFTTEKAGRDGMKAIREHTNHNLLTHAMKHGEAFEVVEYVPPFWCMEFITYDKDGVPSFNFSQRVPPNMRFNLANVKIECQAEGVVQGTNVIKIADRRRDD